MPREIRQYVLVTLLLAVAGFVHGDLMWNQIRLLLHPDQFPAAPFTITVATRTIAGGPFAGDQILALDGRPLNSVLQFTDAVDASRPGDTIHLTLSRPDGRAFDRDVAIPSEATRFQRFSQTAIAIALRLLIPLVAMSLGFGVVLIRPGDRNAWLVLFLMLGFVATVHPPEWEGAVPDLRVVWGGLWNSMWPVALMLFGIYFPTRSLRDQRLPWIKWVLSILFAGVGLGYWTIFLIWQHDINASAGLRDLAVRLSYLRIGAWVIASAGYFGNFRRKSAAESSPDGRRRLSILRAGSWLGLGPVLLLAIYSFSIRTNLFDRVPFALVLTALLLLPLFPLTLGYVIVVERAMDLRFVIRMGVRYGLARFGLWTIRIAAVSIAVSIFATGLTRGLSSIRSLALVGVGGLLLLVRKGPADRASQWIDRKFFREAYDAERVLAGLAAEVGRYLEVQPLLETVAERVGQTLHVKEIVILLREGDIFRTAYSTRLGEPMDIPADSRIVANLTRRAEPLEIYFDKPPLWIRSLNVWELQALDFMRTQLLLPVMGREGLTGIISLGPKLSEAPYSETDTRLLQAVAWQTGMALENSRLLASLAEEAANRERINYELEIAKEVQERLFPQNYPPVQGVDYSGFCRPAHGIGGDYYDFLQLPGGKLGIAIGDVSGKGIAAALLMASLQASLRGQAIAREYNLACLMTNVNRLVFEASTPSRYATFFYAEFDPRTRELAYVNAGHNPPFIVRGQEVMWLVEGGPVVGLLPGARYEQATCSMSPGDLLVLFTDGITEAMTKTEEEWGEDKLIAAVREHSSLDTAHIIQGVFRAVDAFTGSADQYDDMTLLVVKLTDSVS
ncbi:MAG TPA: SpoIIE family protein phosphatase [Bryobacteraceae bacterium]|jgi:sigma-B regulation protein RsbU (phosphoserine phosphatase)|nr:SpoIIE family protein phosphatase [Bryobacteraceae bacterium]